MPVGDYEFKKVSEDDPTRCQGGRGRTGQCTMQAVPNSKYCPSHGGNSAIIANREKAKFEYRAGVWSARIKEASESDNIKDMRKEVGVLKMLIEERLCSASNVSELLIQAGPVGDLTVKMQKLVKQITEYDIACGNTLDKQQLIQFAESFVAIAAKYIKDEDDKLAFGSEIGALLSAPLKLDEVQPLPIGQRVQFDEMEGEETEETGND